MNRANPDGGVDGDVVGEIDIDKMKRFIAYCKAWVVLDRRSLAILLIDSAGNAHHGCQQRLRRC